MAKVEHARGTIPWSVMAVASANGPTWPFGGAARVEPGWHSLKKLLVRSSLCLSDLGHELASDASQSLWLSRSATGLIGGPSSCGVRAGVPGLTTELAVA